MVEGIFPSIFPEGIRSQEDTATQWDSIAVERRVKTWKKIIWGNIEGGRGEEHITLTSRGITRT